MHAFEGDAADAGAMIAFRSPVAGGEACEDRIVLRVGGESADGARLPDRGQLRRPLCPEGGPFARRSPARDDSAAAPRQGQLLLAGRAQPFSHLVYPMPGPSVLGVHVGLDLAGRCRFGPDLEWVDEIDYSVDPERAERFYAAVRTFYPSFATGASNPTTPGSGRSCTDRASRSRTSSSRGRRRTGCRVS